MTPAEVPSPIGSVQQTALTCYLSAILAVAKCMSEVCPQVGLAYRSRLLRLPRRLGFDATSEALEASRAVVETDLAEYARVASAWVDAGINRAQELLAGAAAVADNIGQSDALHAAMMQDLAEQMEISAEVDQPSETRASLKRYAAGLRSYVQRRKKEAPAALADLQRQTEGLGEWLSPANPFNASDPLTGLPNRHEAEKYLLGCLHADKPFCIVLFEWAEAGETPRQLGRSGADQIVKKLSERLVTLVRPLDIVCRWGPDQLMVIFDCAGNRAEMPSRRIAGLLSDEYSAVVNESTCKIVARPSVAVIDGVANQPLEELIRRIDTALNPAVGAPAA